MSEMSDRLCDVLATRLRAGAPQITVRQLAVDVLQALREPTKDMSGIGGMALVGDCYLGTDGAADVFRDMIDVAMKDAATPLECVMECRAPDGSQPQGFGNGRAWCQTHGFECPNLTRLKSA